MYNVMYVLWRHNWLCTKSNKSFAITYYETTLCSENNTHSRFQKIFRECLGENKYFMGKKLNILCYRWRRDDVRLPYCKLWVLPLKTNIWWNAKTHQLITVLTEPSCSFPLWTVLVVYKFPWLSWWRGVVGNAYRMKRSYSTPGPVTT